MEKLKELGAQLLVIWQQLGVNQKVTVAASGFVVAGALAVVVFFTCRTDFALLYGGLDPKDAGAITTYLDEQSITYKAGSGSIQVPRDQVHKLRMTLASQGLPSSTGEGVGYELFDEKSTITQSEGVLQINKKRALEGELARSIMTINGVVKANVHVVMPETRLIIDDTRKSKASVTLTLRHQGALKRQAVDSVRSLVANSVPGLGFENVVVHDNFGNLLARNDDGNAFGSSSDSRLMAQVNTEKYFINKVHGLLSSVLGPAEVEVQVSAELNHDQVTHTSQQYDPDGSVTNSVTEKIENTGNSRPSPGGVAGSPANTNISTNSNAGGLANNLQNKSEHVISFNNSMTTTNVVKAAGELKRLTVSVLVNQGETPRDAAALTQLTNIVQNALGLDPSGANGRNDSVQVAEIAFNRAHLSVAQARIDSAATKDMIQNIMRNALYVLLGAGALLAFVKLVNRSKDEVIPTGVPVGQLLAGTPVVAAPGGAAVAAMPGVAATGGAPAMPTDTAEQIDSANMNLEDIEEKLKDPSKLSVAEIQQLRQAREEERERVRLLEELKADEEEENIEVIEQEKQKLIMDFGLGTKQPERVNIEVLRDMIKDNPEAMAVAARRWLGGKGGDDSDAEDGK